MLLLFNLVLRLERLLIQEGPRRRDISAGTFNVVSVSVLVVC
jgi:hypothetical protein